MDSQQGECAPETADDLTHGLGEVAELVIGARQEMRDDLGVGLAQEQDAVFDQGGSQPVEVLDDAVVDQRKLAVLATAVRVRVLVGRAAVGGPAGVPDGRA